MDFLTEVAESCQKDVFSEEYYQQMGINSENISRIKDSRSENNYLEGCIKSRYLYLQVISKFPWLVSTEELLPGYPATVKVSLISYGRGRDYSHTNILNCLVSQNKESKECTNSALGSSLYNYRDGYAVKFNLDNVPVEGWSVSRGARLGYTCPSCFVAYNNNPSGNKIVEAFMQWFAKLDKLQRKELMSILGDEQTQQNNRRSMKQEANDAWNEYTAIRERMAEEEKERRRRELLGE